MKLEEAFALEQGDEIVYGNKIVFLKGYNPMNPMKFQIREARPMYWGVVVRVSAKGGVLVAICGPEDYKRDMTSQWVPYTNILEKSPRKFYFGNNRWDCLDDDDGEESFFEVWTRRGPVRCGGKPKRSTGKLLFPNREMEEA